MQEPWDGGSSMVNLWFKDFFVSCTFSNTLTFDITLGKGPLSRVLMWTLGFAFELHNKNLQHGCLPLYIPIVVMWKVNNGYDPIWITGVITNTRRKINWYQMMFKPCKVTKNVVDTKWNMGKTFQGV